MAVAAVDELVGPAGEAALWGILPGRQPGDEPWDIEVSEIMSESQVASASRLSSVSMPDLLWYDPFRGIEDRQTAQGAVGIRPMSFRIRLP
jgi:hypothetical protein